MMIRVGDYAINPAHVVAVGFENKDEKGVLLEAEFHLAGGQTICLDAKENQAQFKKLLKALEIE